MRFLLAIACLVPALARAAPLTVCIDPGHGGWQSGARGPNKTYEKNLTLAIAKRFAQKVRSELHAQVLLTREDDAQVALNRRTTFANAHAADVFISIHLNSMPTGRERRRVTGTETFFLSANASGANAARVAAAENAEDGVPRPHAHDDLTAILDDLAITAAHRDSSRLAESIQESLAHELGVVDRGVQQAPFAVLNGAAMPAVLVEVGFISHPEEGVLLGTPEYQEKVADALVHGLRAFLEPAPKTTPSAAIASASAGPAPDAGPRPTTP